MANIPKVWNGTAFIELEAAATVAPAASTSVVGIVQLTDSTSSTSTTTAATPNSVKSAYDLAGTAIPKNTVTTTGDILYASGSATVARLGIGTASQVLSVGTAGVPTWTTATSSTPPAVFGYWWGGQSVTGAEPDVDNIIHTGSRWLAKVKRNTDSVHAIYYSGTASSAGTSLPVLTSGWTSGGTVVNRDDQTFLLSDGAGKVVYPASGSVFYSTNHGTSWTSASATGLDAYGGVFGGTQFVLASSNGTIYTSTNASTWNAQTSQFGAGTVIYDVSYDGTYFVAVGNNGKNSRSTDAVTWTANTAFTNLKVNGGTAAVMQVAGGGGVTVCALEDNASRVNIYYSTTGGSAWTASDAPYVPLNRGDQNAATLMHDGTYFWIHGASPFSYNQNWTAEYLLRSSNGANWTIVPMSGIPRYGTNIFRRSFFAVNGEMYVLMETTAGNPTQLAKKIAG